MPINPSLIDSLRELPGYLRRIAQGMTVTGLTSGPDDGGFSLVEHACHLRDYEREGVLARIDRILKEENPLLMDFRGEQLARERNYRAQNFAAALEDFEQDRARTLGLLASLSDEQLARTAEFGTMGRINLTRLISAVAEHDRTHQEEIKQLLEELKVACREENV